MNKQEVFEKVVKHLFTQGKRAVATAGDCMYRAEDGLMCAVGCLIPDEVYDRGMEYTDVNGLLAAFKDVLPPFIEEHKDFLTGLQRVHDNHLFWENSSLMRRTLQAIGLSHGLNTYFVNRLDFKAQ